MRKSFNTYSVVQGREFMETLAESVEANMHHMESVFTASNNRCETVTARSQAKHRSRFFCCSGAAETRSQEQLGKERKVTRYAQLEMFLAKKLISERVTCICMHL